MSRQPRKDESFAQVAFDQLLRERHPSDHLQWHVPCVDPPDFRLDWCQNHFAVEVTSLVERSTLTDPPLETVALNRSLCSFVNRIETDALREDVLHGTYELTLGPIADLRHQQEQIRSSIFQYLRLTVTDSDAPPSIVLSDPQPNWAIRKLSSAKDRILVLLDGGAKWEGEMLADISTLLQRAITDKKHALRNISDPIILLLLDRYHFADDDDWASSLRPLDLTPLCAVIRVDGNARCQVFHSSLSRLQAAI